MQELTVREAAQRVHRSAETIRRWIWSGRLPAVKRGNTYYVDVVRLDAVVVEFGGQPRHAAAAADDDDGPDLAQWLDELGQWKAGIAAGTAESASELVTQDRHARR